MPARHPLRGGHPEFRYGEVLISRTGARHSTSAGAHLAALSSDVESATGPRWASLSGLTIELIALI